MPYAGSVISDRPAPNRRPARRQARCAVVAASRAPSRLSRPGPPRPHHPAPHPTSASPAPIPRRRAPLARRQLHVGPIDSATRARRRVGAAHRQAALAARPQGSQTASTATPAARVAADRRGKRDREHARSCPSSVTQPLEHPPARPPAPQPSRRRCRPASAGARGEQLEASGSRRPRAAGAPAVRLGGQAKPGATRRARCANSAPRPDSGGSPGAPHPRPARRHRARAPAARAPPATPPGPPQGQCSALSSTSSRRRTQRLGQRTARAAPAARRPLARRPAHQDRPPPPHARPRQRLGQSSCGSWRSMVSAASGGHRRVGKLREPAHAPHAATPPPLGVDHPRPCTPTRSDAVRGDRVIQPARRGRLEALHVRRGAHEATRRAARSADALDLAREVDHLRGSGGLEVAAGHQSATLAAHPVTTARQHGQQQPGPFGREGHEALRHSPQAHLERDYTTPPSPRAPRTRNTHLPVVAARRRQRKGIMQQAIRTHTRPPPCPQRGPAPTVGRLGARCQLGRVLPPTMVAIARSAIRASIRWDLCLARANVTRPLAVRAVGRPRGARERATPRAGDRDADLATAWTAPLPPAPPPPRPSPATGLSWPTRLGHAVDVLQGPALGSDWTARPNRFRTGRTLPACRRRRHQRALRKRRRRQVTRAHPPRRRRRRDESPLVACRHGEITRGTTPAWTSARRGRRPGRPPGGRHAAWTGPTRHPRATQVHDAR